MTPSRPRIFAEEISSEQAARLHALHLVEGRWPQLRITSNIAIQTNSRAEYIRSKGLNDEACKLLILQMLGDTGPAKRAQILAMLDDLLPSGLDKRQKARKVSNLLTEMKRDDHTVTNEGVGKSAIWRIR